MAPCHSLYLYVYERSGDGHSSGSLHLAAWACGAPQRSPASVPRQGRGAHAPRPDCLPWALLSLRQNLRPLLLFSPASTGPQLGGHTTLPAQGFTPAPQGRLLLRGQWWRWVCVMHSSGGFWNWFHVKIHHNDVEPAWQEFALSDKNVTSVRLNFCLKLSSEL